MREERPYIPGLTSLRWFAAFHVMLAHFVRAAPILKADVAKAPAWLVTLSGGAYWAVSAFFVMSGFVLVYMHADRPLKGFYWGRFARVYPAYLLSLIILAPQFFLLGIGHSGADWESQHKGLIAFLVPAMLQSWVPGAAEAWNGVTWTLSVDIACYAAFPLLLPLMTRFSRRALFFTLALCYVAMLVPPTIYMATLPDGALISAVGRHGEFFWLAAIRYHPIARLPEFLIGMALGHLFLRSPAENERLAVGLIALALAGIGVTTALIDRIPVPWWHSGLLPFASAALVYGLALRPRFVRFMDHPWLVKLGDVTYGFYLFHVSIIATTVLVFGRFVAPFAGSSFVVLAVAFGLSLAAAFVVARVVERPARRWLLNARR